MSLRVCGEMYDSRTGRIDDFDDFPNLVEWGSEAVDADTRMLDN